MNQKISKGLRWAINRSGIPNKFAKRLQDRSWRAYGNTHGEDANQLYESYTQRCRLAYEAAGNETIKVDKSPLASKGTFLVESALDSKTAHKMSNDFTSLIEQDKGLLIPPSYSHLMTGLAQPVDDLGTELLDIFDNSALDQAITGYFGSYYRLEWIDCYRSHPASQVGGSWMWHTDDVPPQILKVMLHLTDAGADQGATRFLSASHTREFGNKGYRGYPTNERTDNLVPFAEKNGLSCEPFLHDAKAGDALIFNTNLLHKAIPPSTGYRDVSTIFVMPNPIPWRKQLEREGPGKFQTNKRTWPSNPEPSN